MSGPINRVLPSYFDEIDKTKGASGFSHLDAEQKLLYIDLYLI